MQLTKSAMAIANLASTDKFRINLNHVHFGHDAVEATDGHMLGRVSLAQSKGIDVYVPAADVLRAAKQAKKGATVVVDIPVTGTIDATADERPVTFSANGVTVAATGIAPHAASFPDTAQIWPQGEPTASITFNANLMATLLEVAAAIGPKSGAVRLDVYDAVSPMRLTTTNVETGETASFLLMPMRV